MQRRWPSAKRPTKSKNKKLRWQRDSLSTDCFEHGKLDGAELALFIHYPKRGGFHSYMSNNALPWLQDVPMMVNPQL